LAVARALGHGVFYAVMGILFVVAAILGIGADVDVHEPTYWGTFTEHSCQPSRYGCEPVGTWVSDDGSIVKTHIQLDAIGSVGTSRASYTPTGFNNDAQNDIVHTGTFSSANYWFPWVFCVLVVALVAGYAYKWRRTRQGERLSAN
jgi:hypothetical protein